MRHLINFILLLFISVQASAQDRTCTFVKVLEWKDELKNATGTYNSPDGNLIITFCNNSGNSGIAKLSPQGDFIWSKSVDIVPDGTSADIEIIRNLIVDKSGNLVACGFNYGVPKAGFVFKFDTTSLTVVASYQTKDYCFFDIEQRSDGNYLLGGLRNQIGGAVNLSILVPIDRNTLFPLNSQIYNYSFSNYDDHLETLIPFNGSYYGAGGGEVTQFGANTTGLIQKYDQNGNPLWGAAYVGTSFSFRDIYAQRIVADQSGIAIAHQASDLMTGNNVAVMVKTDLEGNLLWSKKYEISGKRFVSVNGLLKLGSGYLLSGSVNRDTTVDVFLCALDSLGTIQWSKWYGGVGKEAFLWSAPVIRNSNIFLFLTSDTYMKPGSLVQTMLISTDLEGNLDDTCKISRPASIKESKLTLNSVRVKADSVSATFFTAPLSPSITDLKLGTNTVCQCITCNLLVTLPADTLLISPQDTSRIELKKKGANGLIKTDWAVRKGNLSCDTCNVTYFKPKCQNACECENDLIIVNAVDANGCRASDTMYVRIVLKLSNKLLTPNAFSPDGDGTNDKFTIFSDDGGCLKEILYLRIFSRWGPVVWETYNIPVGELTSGWDGTSDRTGEPLPQDVYLYDAKVRLTDGTEKQMKGEIMLIR